MRLLYKEVFAQRQFDDTHSRKTLISSTLTNNHELTVPNENVSICALFKNIFTTRGHRSTYYFLIYTQTYHKPMQHINKIT